ncbi:MAG: diacylglycerol kinase family lipid kinase [Clostridia bacterium]|nr:diacylglycerol kinase family lipid kinase [Clostridia bacterium]
MNTKTEETFTGSSEDAMKPVFIVNPIAGTSLCEKQFAEAERQLKAMGAEYAVRYSEYAGHSVELAKQALAEGRKFIVAVGGDGTVNEIASVLAGVPGVKFGILPFGTGNDLASVLGIPTDPAEAAKLILNGKAVPCDLGTANGKVFANICGLGFDVDVLRSVDKHKKGHQGMLPYLIGIMDALRHRTKVHARITTDGGEKMELDAMMITVCNGQRFGGGIRIAPEARSDDGLFDICIIKWIGLPTVLGLLPKAINGKHLGKKPVIYTRAKKVEITTDEELLCETDGETVLSTPLTCEIMPGALSIVRPQ